MVNYSKLHDQRGSTALYVLIAIVVVGVIASLFWIFPTYNVWVKEQEGRAQLAEAEYSKRIAVEEAKALVDSAADKAKARVLEATAEADAEIARAKGAAEANRIIGDSLKGNTDYLRYLYIEGLKTSPNQKIYIPTEAGLPILEAGGGN